MQKKRRRWQASWRDTKLLLREFRAPLLIWGITIARACVLRASKLNGMTVAVIEERYDVSVALVRRNKETDMHPSGKRILQEKDTIAILGNPDKISKLVHDNH